MHWLTHVLGLDSASGGWYLGWSGFGSDLAELAIVGGLIGLLRKHNCHVRRCWRIGRHPIAGTGWIVCRRHNPALPPTHADVVRAHSARPPAARPGGRPKRGA